MYISTRGGSESVTASQAIYRGLAPDGGLFVPTEIPVFPAEKLAGIGEYTYGELAKEILSLYLDDYTEAEINDIVVKAYGDNFDSSEVAPLVSLNNKRNVLELWHGPTAAFKDMALQILPHLLTAAIKKQGGDKEVVILVATSGDTGKAALEGFSDVPGTRIITFYPNGGVSEVQRLQMVTTKGQNTAVIAVEGNFDDCQRGVKEIFRDIAFGKKMAENGYVFSSANSINWGRLLPQIVYYFKAYGALVRDGKIQVGDKIDVVVPTGNFGNILACYYSKQMGLPIGNLICASNKNRILTDVIATGVYDCHRDFYRTVSPSMDILISSNFERFVFEMTNRNSETVRDLFSKLDKDGIYRLSPDILKKIQGEIKGYSCGEEETIATIGKVFKEDNYLIDTHTAVAFYGLEVFRRETNSLNEAVIDSTANPYKFNVSVYEAIAGQGSAAGMDEFEVSVALEKISGEPIHRAIKHLDTLPVRHNTVIEKGDMAKAVSDLLFK